MLRLFFILLTFAAFTQSAQAFFDFDLSLQGGEMKTALQGDSYSTNKLYSYGGAVSVLIPVYRIIGVGARTDYHLYAQQSVADLAKGGNRSGRRWVPVSPFMDLHFGIFRLRFEYQFTGTYTLSYETASGKALSYGSPTGFTGEIHACLVTTAERYYKIPGRCIIYAGLYFTQVKFGTEILGSRNVPLDTKLSLQDVGLTIGLGF